MTVELHVGIYFAFCNLMELRLPICSGNWWISGSHMSLSMLRVNQNSNFFQNWPNHLSRT